MNSRRNPVGWFELYVQDMERAEAFYEATFATTLEKLPSPGMDMLVFPMLEGAFSGEDCASAPGCPGALVKMDGVPSGGGGTLISIPPTQNLGLLLLGSVIWVSPHLII